MEKLHCTFIFLFSVVFISIWYKKMEGTRPYGLMGEGKGAGML